jgi:hypothetical protein
MAFDLQNDYFISQFTGGDGNTYEIQFYPAHNLDVTSANGEYFLDNQIFPEIKGSVSLPDNVPFGMTTARSLELKVNLANFSGDYEDVATQIVRGRSASTRTVNGRDIYIPNVWRLFGGTNTDYYYAQLPSEQDIDISKGKAEYTISLIGIEKAIFEQLSIEDLDLDSLTPTYNIDTDNSPSKIIWDIAYDVGSSDYRYIGQEPNNRMKLYSNSAFFTNIETKADNILDAIGRGFYSDNCTIGITDIDDIWTFYEQDITTNHSKSATTVDFEDLLIIGGVIDGDGNYNDGFFDPSKNGIYSYNNVWSYLRQLCNSMKLKGVWTDSFTLNFYPALDSISATNDVGALDPKEFKLAPTANYISQATAFVLGSGSADKDEYRAISDYGSLDGDSQDSELMYNTYTLKFLEGLEAGKEDGSNDKFVDTASELRRKQNASTRSYYYQKSQNSRNYWKVHEDCDLDIGGGNATISGNTDYTSITYPDHTGSDITDRLPEFSGLETFIDSMERDGRQELWGYALVVDIANRQQYYGMGYNAVEGVKAILGNTQQGVLTAKLGYQIDSSTNLDLSKIGEAFTIDLDTVSEIPSLGTFSGKLILTSIDYDFITGDIDCEFFMRGDAGA